LATEAETTAAAIVPATMRQGHGDEAAHQARQDEVGSEGFARRHAQRATCSVTCIEASSAESAAELTAASTPANVGPSSRSSSSK
jgi:hypothetical protein